MHYRMFSSILNLYPLDASSIPQLTHDNNISRHFWMSLGTREVKITPTKKCLLIPGDNGDQDDIQSAQHYLSEKHSFSTVSVSSNVMNEEAICCQENVGVSWTLFCSIGLSPSLCQFHTFL